MFKNVIGLIVEYNPFHNGHLHHIQEIDRLFEDNIKIAVMSGDFVQRGEPSLINKFEKTKIALSQGIDIVIELPAFYSTQSAEIFAKGSVNLLNKLLIAALSANSKLIIVPSISHNKYLYFAIIPQFPFKIPNPNIVTLDITFLIYSNSIWKIFIFTYHPAK